jgi:hypothetical protein
MAALGAPAFTVTGGILGAPLMAGAPLSKFFDFHSSASHDEFNRQDGTVMAIFESLPGGPMPQQLRELVVVNNQHQSTLGFAVLVIPTPVHQGMIYAIHSLSKFATRLGQPCTQWDNRIFTSIGEVIANQNSITVKFPNTAFSHQNGGNFIWVGHAQHMAAMFGANPNLQQLGEFNNFDAGTELIHSCNIMVTIPLCSMSPLTHQQA